MYIIFTRSKTCNINSGESLLELQQHVQLTEAELLIDFDLIEMDESE